MSMDQSTATAHSTLHSVAIRFAGDSGDGMQITGSRFTSETARLGNDLATRPDFPAEIRAPAGTIGGVSAFQIHFGSQEIFTAGDAPDVLIAMNPAALKANINDLKPNGIVICNSDTFTDKNLQKAGYDSNPLDDDSIRTKFNLIPVALTTLTLEAIADVDIKTSAKEKCKNFFALGIVCYLYNRGVDETVEWLEKKFARTPEIVEANKRAIAGGQAFAQASEFFTSTYEIPAAQLAPGVYRNITGNQGIALGLIAAAQRSQLSLFYAGYPITPASDILHELSRHKEFGVVTYQAEDEIASCCAALGASYSGALGVTASSGPGILLKQETIGLAATAEFPLVIINVQRAGPSTGMPTKTEQSDLLQSLFGRNGECPVAVISVSSPEDAFESTIEACRIAMEHMTPVFLLSDGYIGNGSQPWLVPDVDSLPVIQPPFIDSSEADSYLPYQRDDKQVRRFAIPGTPNFEHRIGGIEKHENTGNISYDPLNHQRMTDLRAEKIDKIADTLPELKVSGNRSGELLVVGWGSTSGALSGAVARAQSEGHSVSYTHLRYLNPFPRDLESLLRAFTHVLVPELNSGQLALLLRAKFLIDVKSLSKVQGQPFKIEEVYQSIIQLLDGEWVSQG